MCTLTIYRDKGYCIATMNRDERRSRQELGELCRSENGNPGVIYPVDEQSGGTWMGANDRGVVLCLLNRYQPDLQLDAGSKSRGGIIPAALAHESRDAILRHLSGLECHDYPPFDLFLISPVTAYCLQWNGREAELFQVSPEPWYIHSSSALDTPDVIAHRGRLFRTLVSDMKADMPVERMASSLLEDFHLSQDEHNKAYSVLMDRDEAHTKSVSQATVGGGRVNFHYLRRDAGTQCFADAIEESMALTAQ